MCVVITQEVVTSILKVAAVMNKVIIVVIAEFIGVNVQIDFHITIIQMLVTVLPLKEKILQWRPEIMDALAWDSSQQRIAEQHLEYDDIKSLELSCFFSMWGQLPKHCNDNSISMTGVQESNFHYIYA